MIRADRLQLAVANRVLLREASFELRPGEFVAVLGRNGAGKTTLLRALCGLRAPAGGRCLIGASDARELHPAQRARSVAHVTGDDLFIDRLTVLDVVSMGRYAHHRWWEWTQSAEDDRCIAGALQAVGMNGFGGRRFDTLSSGERQRVWLALALAQEAPVLLLDEPTSHLDVRVAHDILRLLRAQADNGKTVVCVLHDVNEAAQYADRVMLLGCERVLAMDVPDRVLTPQLLEAAYGIAMEVVRSASGALRIFPVAREEAIQA